MIDAWVVDLVEDPVAQREPDAAVATHSGTRPLLALDVQRAGIPGQPGAKVSVTM